MLQPAAIHPKKDAREPDQISIRWIGKDEIENRKIHTGNFGIRQRDFWDPEKALAGAQGKIEAEDGVEDHFSD